MEGTSNIDRLDDTGVHDWYRHVYAYSDRIITDLAAEWDLGEDDLVLDPFNGTGTTTLAAKRVGIDAIGTDINPVGVLAGQVKTNWDIDTDLFRSRVDDLLGDIEAPLREIGGEGRTTLYTFDSDREPADLSKYDFSRSPKEPKGWLCEKPHRKMCVVKHHVNRLPDDEVTDLIRLAMAAILPEEIGNVGFGPEAYRLDPQGDVDVYRALARKLEKMARDLERTIREAEESNINPGRTEVLRADAREVGDVLRKESTLLTEHEGIDAVITSPPYPAEHDYTRNQRLELLWLDAVWDNDDLRELKRSSIRSHTKSIYADDDAGDRLDIRNNDRIDEIVAEMEEEIDAAGDDISGFEQTYPRVVEEYFAGMVEHFESVRDVMAPGGRAGYVVADQQSYWNVPIQTGEILGELAENRVGFDVEGIKLWRNLQSTTGEADELAEEILVLRKPADGH